MSFEIPTYPLRLQYPSLAEIASLKPKKNWGLNENRSGWMAHGDGHIARLLVLFTALLEKLEMHDNISLDKNSIAAIILSIITHDLRYETDVECMYNQKAHQKKAADQEWLHGILNELTLNSSALFEGIDCWKVLSTASHINRVHDYHSSEKALECLNAEYHEDETTLSQEMNVFLDLDSGLEIVRLEVWLHKTFPHAFIANLLSGVSVLQNKLHHLQNPIFKSTSELRPFATWLYQESRKNPEYNTDQWRSVMEVARHMAGN